MLVPDMLDDVVQTTLRCQAEPALDWNVTVDIMFFGWLLLVLLGTNRLRSLVFVQLFEFERHIRTVIRWLKIERTLIFASTALLTKLWHLKMILNWIKFKSTWRSVSCPYCHKMGDIDFWYVSLAEHLQVNTYLQYLQINLLGVWSSLIPSKHARLWQGQGSCPYRPEKGQEFIRYRTGSFLSNLDFQTSYGGTEV